MSPQPPVEIAKLSTAQLEQRRLELFATIEKAKDAVMPEARAITVELNHRAACAAMTKALGRDVTEAESEMLRKLAGEEKAKSLAAFAERKAAAKAAGGAMSAAWGQARAAAKAKGETLDKNAWEKQYLARAA